MLYEINRMRYFNFAVESYFFKQVVNIFSVNLLTPSKTPSSRWYIRMKIDRAQVIALHLI